ncbi:MAG: cysteine--tRNA ligase [Candidatus Woesearchaeota archaeon]
MALTIYNTLTRKLEEFTPVESRVRMYNCGPTVYKDVHIGNFRAYVFADILRRTLELNGYEVDQVINLTDVGHMVDDNEDSREDKILKTAKEENITPLEVSRRYAGKFFDEFYKMRLKEPKAFPKATEHVPEIIEITKALLDNGYAYEVNGTVYFDITKKEDYGKLSGNEIKSLQAGARVDVNPEKRNPGDFALWIRDDRHLLQWDSPWGKGYPGWHIECTAMSFRYLTDAFKPELDPEGFRTIDIHTGGEDNVFPHHECEIAQSEGATNKKFINYWLHVKHLMINGKKMSKSEGNFFSVTDLINKGFSPLAIRYALLSVNYRLNMNLTFDSLHAAEKNIRKLNELKRYLESRSGDENNLPEEKIEEFKTQFLEALNDDLNMSRALAVVFDFYNYVYKQEKISKADAQKLLETLEDFNLILDIFEEEEIPKEITELAERRKEARDNKDFQTADKLRDQIKEKGFDIKDTKEGYNLSKRRS